MTTMSNATTRRWIKQWVPAELQKAFSKIFTSINTDIDTVTSTASSNSSAITALQTRLNAGASLASASALPAPTGRVHLVTGTTNITSITTTGLTSGHVFTLVFEGILTFTDGNNIKAAGNFVTTADDTITMVFDGTNCIEICRSVN